MSSKIQELLKGRDEQISYEELITDFPWILQKDQFCILSPDSDGLLCGLFMSSHLNWKIKGFYDGKIMLIEKGFTAKDCIFLDMEIFRKDIRSVGHHMVQFNKKRKPTSWDNFKDCIQPNNLRDYDGYKDFRLKYPLATIHFLLGIMGSKMPIKIPESAICPLFFTDGTFNVLFKYPENVLNWLNFLRAEEKDSPLQSVFENEKYSVFSLMKAMDDFFRQRDDISIENERGDRLRISDTDGNPVNIIKNNGSYDLGNDSVERISKFLKLLSRLTEWEYGQASWSWENFEMHKFTKRDFKKDTMSVCNRNFDEFIENKNPLSWAMTSGNNIEYTLEEPDRFT